MSIVQSVLIASVVFAAALAIRAHYLDPARRWQAYVFKPLATLLVVALALSLTASSPAYRWAVVAGLVFSTAGDVFLMLPRERFVAGLVSFLAGHLCYMYAFSIGVAFPAAPLLWLPFLAAGALVVGMIWRGLGRTLRAAVIAYVLVIAAMAGQATGRWQAVGGGSALAAALGAALFILSDSILALNRFRAPVPADRVLTLGSYWTAQLLIALSIPAYAFSS